MSIEIRLLKKGEEELVNEVYNNALNNFRPLENFLWEFMNGPAGQAIYVVAVDNEKTGNPIVGTQSAIPIVWVCNDGSFVLTGKSEDTYVDPTYRGQKLFDRMYEKLFEECRKAGIKIIWGFTYARKPFLKVGFEMPADTLQGLFVNNIVKSAKYLSALNSQNTLRQRLQITGLCFAAYMNRLLFNAFKSELPDEFTYDNNFISGKSGLVCSSLSIGTTKYYDLHQSPEYNDWRFKRNPFRNNYTEWNYYKNGKWVFSVLCNFRPEGFAYIEQMYFLPELPENEKVTLIRNVISQILKKDPYLVRFWGFERNNINSGEINLLKKAGFIFIKKGTGIVWKNLQTSGEVEIKFNQVHFSRAYTQGNI